MKKTPEDILETYIPKNRWDNNFSLSIVCNVAWEYANQKDNNTTPDNSIEESPEEEANERYLENYICDYDSGKMITYSDALNAMEWAANHQKEVDKAKVEQVIKATIRKSDKANGLLPESTCGWNNALENILSQIKAL